MNSTNKAQPCAVRTEIQLRVRVSGSQVAEGEVLRRAQEAGGTLRAQLVCPLQEETVFSFVCERPEEAALVLKRENLQVTTETVVTAQTRNRPGALSHLVRTLEVEGIGIGHSYASWNSGHPFVVFRTDNNPKAEDVLRNYLQLGDATSGATGDRPSATDGGAVSDEDAGATERVAALRCVPTNEGEAKLTNFRELLAEWKRIAAEYNLSYWLTWGTLLGCYRNGQFIPWDGDVDVAVKMEAIATLERIPYRHDRYALVVHPDWRKRLQERKPVNQGYVTFDWPDARLVDRQTNRRLDVFSYKDHLKGFLIDNTPPEYGGPFIFPGAWVFPLADRTIDGMSVPCPRQPQRILRKFYGDDLSPDHEWRDGRWERIR